MTLPDERSRAVEQTETFLKALIDPAETPRVPHYVREWARSCLRHYPSHYDMERAAREYHKVFGDKHND